jgi:hypothetical protein
MNIDNNSINKLDIHERAENHVYARLLAAERELKQAKEWDGRGSFGSPEEIEDIKQKQIIYAQRRVEVQTYILNKLYDK